MGEYIVYKHTTPNEKVYIGITKRKPEERWQEGRGYKCNHHFTNAIRKYGWDNIEHEIICMGLNENDAKQMEKFLIQVYKSYDSKYGYNKTLGGDSVAIGIEKGIFQYDLSGKLVGKFNSLTEASKLTKTSISRISDCANGKRLSSNGFIWLYGNDSQKRERLREKIKEKKHPSKMCGGANHCARPIDQYTLDGVYVKTYPSAQEAADALNIDYSTIKGCASEAKSNIRCKSAGNYIWIHSDEYNKQEALAKRINKGCEKPVSQYSINGEHIRDFDSIKDALLFLNAKVNHISDVCNGVRKTACGYVWEWKRSDSETIRSGDKEVQYAEK